MHTALAFERRFGNQIKAFVVRFSGVATALSSRFVETRGQMRFAGIEKGIWAWSGRSGARFDKAWSLHFGALESKFGSISGD